MIILPIIGNLIWLLLLGGTIVLIVRAVGRRSDGDGNVSGTMIRRFFQYGLMLALLGVVSAGVVGLLGQVLQRDGGFAGDDTGALASFIAFVVVGGPALAALAVWNARLHAADSAERRSVGFAFYMTAALSGSLIIGGFAAFRTLRWAFAESGFNEGALATAIVAATVWAIHWRIADQVAYPPRMEVNRVIGSAAGLVGTAVAVGFGLGVALGELYDAAYGTFVTESLSDGLRTAAAGALVAGPMWWWHWREQARRTERTTLWYAYLLLFGVLGALVTAMVAAGTMLYLLLTWFVGDPDTASSAAWFDPVPGALAALVVGAVGWGYHRLALAAGPDAARTEVDRVYDYLLAAAGLVAAWIGSVALLAAIVEALVPGGETLAEGSGAEVLVFSLTMLGVGVPLWLRYWSRAQAQARLDEAEEVRSVARRTYVMVLLGAAAAILPFAVLAMVIVGLEALLDGRFGWETLSDMRVGIALTLTCAAGAGYHFTMFRGDRAALPAERRPAVRDVVLVSSDGAGVAAAISEQVGARVRVWHRLDVGAGAEPPVAEVVAAVRAATHEHVMVLTGPTGAFDVVPFDDR